MTMKFKVVFIDDEEAILNLYSSFLEESDFEFVGFSSPQDGLDFLKENSTNTALVISDFKMPEMDGFEVRSKMIEMGIDDIPFSLVTGFYDKEMAVQGMKLKVSSFIEKPVEEKQILDLINEEGKERIESILEDREMISEFLQETKPMLEEIEDLILSLEEDPHDMRAVNTYFRLLHTIKGTSSCLGLNEVSAYAHKYEDLITRVKENELSANKNVINVLLKGLDQLKELYAIAETFKPFPLDMEERATIFDQDFSADVVTENTEKSEGSSSSASSQGEEKEKKGKDEKVSVSEGLLADFLEMSGELTVIRNSIFKTLTKVQSKLPGDKDIDQLGESLGEMQKVSAVLQNQISEMKKVSIENVYRPMRRVVRDSCSVLNKEVDFVIEGDNLKIDTTVAKLLNGALVHMLRNGVDHGIESPEEREKLGKPKEGKLTLNSYETGEDIVVEIIDDGKGLNKDFLKKRAFERGIYTQEELEKMSDQKIYSIIFESGFSTNTEVTSVSGRGVGMDMVRSSIEEFGGKILIDSKVGEGSKFILVIPIPRSILIIKSLLVGSFNHKFNIPLDDVDEVVLYDKSKDEQQIHTISGGLVLKHHNELCPLVGLGQTLNLTDESHIGELQNIVIVKGEGFRFGILVDSIEDIEEIVVKKLSSHFDIGEFLGTTFADDGALSMILDCKGIAKRYGIEKEIDEDYSRFMDDKVEAEDSSDFMRFSLDSMANCAIPLEWVYRLEEIHTKDIQFTGERGLVRYRGNSLPLLYVENLLGMTSHNLEDLSKEDSELCVLVINYKNKLYGAIIKELNDIASSSDSVEEAYSDREGVRGTLTIDEMIFSVIDVERLINPKEGTLVFNNLDDSEDKDSAVAA